MATPDAPELPAPPRWEVVEESGIYRRRREYEEIAAMLRALRAADFDLANPEDGTDERLLTKMFQEWRIRYDARVERKSGAAKLGRWIAMAVGGAVITLFGPEAKTWIQLHWP